jgi:hypothetical protein
MQRCLYVTNIIYPCIQDGLTLLEDPSDTLKLPVKDLTQNKASCCSSLKRILYTPSISERGLSVARLICSKLKHAGHHEAARVFWLFVAFCSSE